jgi:MFS family permease
MSPATPRTQPNEVRDCYGGRYRVGESDRELLGYPRRRVVWAAWVAMLAASIGQYGYGALLPTLGASHGWTLQQGFWVLAVWVLCQSTTVYPVARLRRRAELSPLATMVFGAVLCATGLVSLGGSGSWIVVLLNHGMLGGIGAGLIYGTCLGVVAKWYPERPSRAAFVSGAFAYGCIPFVVLAGISVGPGDLGVVLTGAALLALVLVSVAGLALKDPPDHWWPAHIDPVAWAMDKKLNPALRNNRPAIRNYEPSEALRCPESRTLLVAMTFATAVALFDAAFLALFVTEHGWSLGIAATVVCVLVGSSGTARVAAGWAGGRFGRVKVARAALALGAVAQLLILLGGERNVLALVLAGTVFAGASAGTCFALLPSLVEGHFGDGPGLPNFGLFYRAKAAGALLGVAVMGYLVLLLGFGGTFWLAAGLGLAGAGLVGRLRQPGRPRLLLPA